MSFSDMPVDVGPVYEGERIRAKQMYVELGGPKMEKHFELVRVKPAELINDGEVILHGPDLKDMEEGSTHPIGILVEVAGPELEEDLEAVLRGGFMSSVTLLMVLCILIKDILTGCEYLNQLMRRDSTHLICLERF